MVLVKGIRISSLGLLYLYKYYLFYHKNSLMQILSLFSSEETKIKLLKFTLPVSGKTQFDLTAGCQGLRVCGSLWGLSLAPGHSSCLSQQGSVALLLRAASSRILLMALSRQHLGLQSLHWVEPSWPCLFLTCHLSTQVQTRCKDNMVSWNRSHAQNRTVTNTLWKEHLKGTWGI